ncbi:hypothetical protein P0E61_10085 [Enterococcus faecalis]|uniref:hypothetical protein n=1 Tax=Enterococcus faecalis TaxID=1351 RepID=UPI0025AF68CA|nr:hypothetical protein [Enterococcus faecalis]MDN3100693.1 hypothetical protein [Enterococcus faecalis]MDN3103405.1 hypothetical protein [Enterococcus faecalis]
MKSYSLVYWSGVDDETGAFKQIDCLINDETVQKLLEGKPKFISIIIDETVQKLLEGKPKFISIIIDDGEQMLIQTDNINQIKQVYEKYGRKA